MSLLRIRQSVAQRVVRATFASLALFVPQAVAAPDYPKEETIRDLAHAWYQSRYVSDSNKYLSLANRFYFSSDSDRNRYINGRPQPNNPLEYGIIMSSPPSSFIIAPRPEGLGDNARPMAWVYIPREASRRDSIYISVPLSFVRVNDEWQIRYDPYQPTPRQAYDREKPGIEMELRFKRLQAELEKWSTASEEELRVLTAELRDDALYTRTALETYMVTIQGVPADENVLAPHSQRADEISRRLASMAPAQLRSAGIGDIRAEIARLQSGIDRERRMREQSQMIIQWLEAHPQIQNNPVHSDAAARAMRAWLKDHDTLDGFVYHNER